MEPEGHPIWWHFFTESTHTEPQSEGRGPGRARTREGVSFVGFWARVPSRPSFCPSSSSQFPSQENQGTVSRVNASIRAWVWGPLSLRRKDLWRGNLGLGVPQEWGLENWRRRPGNASSLPRAGAEIKLGFCPGGASRGRSLRGVEPRGGGASPSPSGFSAAHREALPPAPTHTPTNDYTAPQDVMQEYG